MKFQADTFDTSLCPPTSYVELKISPVADSILRMMRAPDWEEGTFLKNLLSPALECTIPACGMFENSKNFFFGIPFLLSIDSEETFFQTHSFFN